MSWKMKIWQAERFAGWRNRQMWFHKRDKLLCQKVKSAFMRIRYLRPCPGGFGNTRFSQGWRRSCLSATGGLPVTSGKPGGKVLRRRVEEVVAQTGRTWHFDIRFLQVEMFQIEWNRTGKSFFSRRFQVLSASMYGHFPYDMRRKKMFFQPNGKSISWDWNAFRLKKIKKRTSSVKKCVWKRPENVWNHDL